MDTSRAHRNGSQTAIPYCLMRGGTSRGPMFLASDLPLERELRDQVLVSLMGSPHPLQVDGVGGGHPLTSKAGIVGRSECTDIDLDFTFVQVDPNTSSVQATQNCGNILAAVVPFAIEAGLLAPVGDVTAATVRTTNTGLVSLISVLTPVVNGQRVVQYYGDTQIAGVAGTAAPVQIRFLNTEGSIAKSLLPSGNVTDVITVDDRDYTVTLIDNGQPLVIVRAETLGVSGYETVSELENNENLNFRLERLRQASGRVMGLGDVSSESYPKMTLVAAPQQSGAISTRSFIPHRVHESIGVLAAVTVATALFAKGSVADEVGFTGTGLQETVEIEHPSGSSAIVMDLDPTGAVLSSGTLRTTRLISRGLVYVPASVWSPDAKTTLCN